MKQLSLVLVIVALACAACGGNDITNGTTTTTIATTSTSSTTTTTIAGPVLKSNPGGPYSGDANRNITMNGLGSTSSPFPIAHFFWNCGQTPHGKPCDQDDPTPEFEYLKTGKIGSPNAVFTVTLRIVDTMGNSNTATTTVSIRQAYE